MESGAEMSIKDYLKDRLLYILFYFINTFLVILVMTLSLIIGKVRIPIADAAYVFLLSVVFLVLLLSIDYLKKREFYKALSQSLREGEDLEQIFSLPDNIDREHDVVKKLLTKSYMTFENKLDRYRKTYKNQMYFNNCWIHQMKTPVSVIKLALENEKEKNIDAKTRKSYESMEEEIEKLSNGLELALYTLRVNDFELDFKVEEMSLLEIVRNVINENKNAFIVNSIYPKIPSEEDLRVKSDKKWIKFVIGQIVNNSIKYSKVKARDSKAVIFRLYREDNRSILSIEDMGVGIPTEDLGRIFNPFFTGKNGRTYLESTGMGLYLAKEICAKLGHSLEVESVEGEGTTIGIIFHKGKSIYNL
jgi:signal transduction histidine kinase